MLTWDYRDLSHGAVTASIFDTHQAVRRLEAAGIETRQAEAVISEMRDAVGLVTDPGNYHWLRAHRSEWCGRNVRSGSTPEGP